MKGLFETLRNIYKIEDLRNRILTTLGLIMIYRLGSYVVTLLCKALFTFQIDKSLFIYYLLYFFNLYFFIYVSSLFVCFLFQLLK